jgi:hypothetical protein
LPKENSKSHAELLPVEDCLFRRIFVAAFPVPQLSGAISQRLATGEDEPPFLGSPLNGVSLDEDDVSPPLLRSSSLTTSLLEREIANARGEGST